MALRNYKALKDFDRKGTPVQAGEELVLSDREGGRLLAVGCVADGRALDPLDPKDSEKIQAAELEYKQEYQSDMKKEKARDDVKQEDLHDEDQNRKALVREATELATAIMAFDGNVPSVKDIEAMSSLPTDQLEAAVEKMRAELEKLRAPGDETPPKDDAPTGQKIAGNQLAGAPVGEVAKEGEAAGPRDATQTRRTNR